MRIDDDRDVVVIGAGAAGLLAASQAAFRGRNTLLLEKNPRPGIKILMSGGTRCNLTHATDARGIISAFGPNGRFLHSALAALGPQQLVELFHAEGVLTKVESGGKVFPVSDRAEDVLDALLRRTLRSGCELALGEPVAEVAADGLGFAIRTPARCVHAEHVIIASGGCSYPGSGTTGDGYGWARHWGHSIVPVCPALTPVTTDAAWVKTLRGITIPDVEVAVADPVAPSAGHRGCLARRRGSLLLAHFGFSGPVVLDVSREVSRHAMPGRLVLEIDWIPSQPREAIDAALREQQQAGGRRQLARSLPALLPQRLSAALLEAHGLDPALRLAELSRVDRGRVVELLKQSRIPIRGTLGFQKAEVTAGGVSLTEVDSRTMESRLQPGLFFAGEVLDLDGAIGGYNFQAAFSTGWLAGHYA